METRMTPPPQADAPPTPDEMPAIMTRARQLYARLAIDQSNDALAEVMLFLDDVADGSALEQFAAAIAAALSTTAARYREALATERFEWQPIDVAPRETGVEILGTRIMSDKMIREPFISFWSPTLNKFYCDPTHYILMPTLPSAAAILASGLQTTPQETK
jgi:hypothetical protein